MMLSKMKMFFGLFLLVCVGFSAQAAELPMDIAILRGLDKVTGRINTFSIPVGEVGQFGKTFIVPEACYTRPPEEFPEDSVFLYVFEKSLKGENIELFRGWMFSSNPALSSMEHPVYDIWVIGCEKEPKNIKSEGIKKVNRIQEEADEPEKEEKKTDVIEVLPISVQLVPSAVEMEEL